MSTNSRPSKNPADIIDGMHKWKPLERSMLANNLTPKELKTTTTDKKQPMAKKAATMVAKSAVFAKLKKSKSCKVSL